MIELNNTCAFFIVMCITTAAWLAWMLIEPAPPKRRFKGRNEL